MSIERALEVLELDHDYTLQQIETSFKAKTRVLQSTLDLMHSNNELDTTETLVKGNLAHNELRKSLDLLWAAAVHLETALHLDNPGQFNGRYGFSIFEPNAKDWRQALLMHLITTAKRDNAAYHAHGVYHLIQLDQPIGWRTHRIEYKGSIKHWIWENCSRELHYQFWQLLIQKGDKHIAKLLLSQPSFLQLCLREDAYQYGSKVFLAKECIWMDGVAERSIPDVSTCLDGSDLFWATVLGWPMRGTPKFACFTGEPALDALQRKVLPSVSFVYHHAQSRPLASLVQYACEQSHKLKQPQSGPLDFMLKQD